MYWLSFLPDIQTRCPRNVNKSKVSNRVVKFCLFCILGSNCTVETDHFKIIRRIFFYSSSLCVVSFSIWIRYNWKRPAHIKARARILTNKCIRVRRIPFIFKHIIEQTNCVFAQQFLFEAHSLSFIVLAQALFAVSEIHQNYHPVNFL